MDRFTDIDKELKFQRALEFIGETRAGISWERLCSNAVRYSDTLIDILRDKDDMKAFALQKEIDWDYIARNAKEILHRLHFNKDNDYYLILALSRDASKSAVKNRWRDLMMIYHPDKSDSEQYMNADDSAKKINEAYSVLKNDDKRLKYDRRFSEPFIPESTKQPMDARHLGVKLKQRQKDLANCTYGRGSKNLPRILTFSYIAAALLILTLLFAKNRPEQLQNIRTSLSNTISAAFKEKPKEKASDNNSLKHKADRDKGSKAKAVQAVKEDNLKQEKQIAQMQRDDEVRLPNKPVQKTESVHETGVKSQREAKPSTKPVQRTETAVPETAVREPSKKDEQHRRRAVNIPPVTKISTSDIQHSVKKPALPEQQPEPVRKYRLPDNPGAEIKNLTDRYAAAIQSGDINKILSLYSSSVVNDRETYGKLKEAYSKRLSGNKFRYAIRNLQFHKSGEEILLTGRYSLSPDDSAGGANPMTSMTGEITFTLAMEANGLKIVKATGDRN
ncbi:MAG: DnaJ domain-containing protein [Nitrospirae bacterium]|nr:DnaJ domain-containing protein [Nitrospirota bacterium]